MTIKNLVNFKLHYEDLPDYPGIKARVKIIKLKRSLEKRAKNRGK